MLLLHDSFDSKLLRQTRSFCSLPFSSENLDIFNGMVQTYDKTCALHCT